MKRKLQNAFAKSGLLLGLGVSVLLAACSGGGSSTPTIADDDPFDDDVPGLMVTGLNGADPSQTFTRWLGIVDFFRVESRTPGTGDAVVSLRQYDNAVTYDSHIDFYTQELGNCDIRDFNAGEGGGGIGDGGTTPWLSGGESLVINTGSGPWFSLPKIEGGRYATNNELPGALPADATLSIPGDVFPSFADYPLVEPLAPVRLLPVDDELMPGDHSISWVSEAGPGISMSVSLQAYDVDTGDFEGFLVRCAMEDNGSFAFPADVAAVIDDNPYQLFSRLTRHFRRVDLIDGITFFHTSRVAE